HEPQRQLYVLKKAGLGPRASGRALAGNFGDGWEEERDAQDDEVLGSELEIIIIDDFVAIGVAAGRVILDDDDPVLEVERNIVIEEEAQPCRGGGANLHAVVAAK